MFQRPMLRTMAQNGRQQTLLRLHQALATMFLSILSRIVCLAALTRMERTRQQAGGLLLF